MIDVSELSLTAFFKSDSNTEDFRVLLRRCLAERKALVADIGTEKVKISLVNAPPQVDVALHGRWRKPCSDMNLNTTPGARLLTPLLFRMSRIQLSYSGIHTVGRSHRAIADFFARNLLTALVTNMSITICRDTDDVSQGLYNHSFQMQYFYILKSLFPESIFQNRSAGDLMNLVLANTFLPVIQFDDQLLNQGAMSLRDDLTNTSRKNFSVFKTELLDVRRSMLSHYQA